jgi:hypothetical protein
MIEVWTHCRYQQRTAIYFQVVEIENKEWPSILTPFKVIKSNTCKLEPSPVSWNKKLDASNVQFQQVIFRFAASPCWRIA